MKIKNWLTMKRLLVTFCLVMGLITAKAQTLNPDVGQTVKIPVIFHVIYSNRKVKNEGKGNTTENVPTANLLAELKNLHDDFLKLNADTTQVHPKFKPIIGNPNVEFVLADTVLQPNGEKGIIRVKTPFNRGRLERRSPIINRKKYLNVFIGNIKGDGGYFWSNSWQQNAEEHDGVFVDFLWIGYGYRLLTHETGHWLGLYHIYGGDGGATGDNCTIGDSINDTPWQFGPTDDLCESCPPQIKENRCEGERGELTNYNNYMDYSGCRKMFTIGQAERIRRTIFKLRPSLLNNK